MNIHRAALQLGLQLVQCKLGQAVGDPSFSVFNPEEADSAEVPAELPTTPRQVKDRSAKVQPPRIVTTR